MVTTGWATTQPLLQLDWGDMGGLLRGGYESSDSSDVINAHWSDALCTKLRARISDSRLFDAFRPRRLLQEDSIEL